MKNILRNIINFLFPFKCIKCKTFIYTESIFCHKCWNSIEFISEPHCYICSTPLEFSFNIPEQLQICGTCHIKKPLFDQLVTVFKYTDSIKKIILDFKYNDQTRLSKPLANLLASRIESLHKLNFDLITSVPLHKKKLKQRMYNQSSLIANRISKIINTKFMPDLLIRTKNNQSQTQYTKNVRIRNIRGAFDINEKYKHNINNKIYY